MWVDSTGSINLNSILTGKSIGKIAAARGPLPNEAERAKREALRSVSVVVFNEERSEIITGSDSGLLHIWTPTGK